MMVPRSFHYGSAGRTKSSSIQDEKADMMSSKKTKKEVGKKTSSTRPTIPIRMFTVPAPTASRPVVIPTRSQTSKARSWRSRDVEKVSEEGEGSTTPHNPNALPPSMAALLAVTTIPTTKALAARRITSARKEASSRIKILEGIDPEDLRYSVSSSSPRSWDLLQSPPDHDDADRWSLHSDSTIAPLSSFRSLSTDSMPSLEFDLGSPESSSNPLTPSHRSPPPNRRQKSFSHSRPEACGSDHPLSPIDADLLTPNIPMPLTPSPLPPTTTTTPPTPSRSSFKSNLTASLRILSSAARSFTALNTARDEFITRSILSLSPQFTDERRPLPISNTPSPALRRYLNPLPASELHFHLPASPHPSRCANPDICTTSIQLQSYQPSPTPSTSHARSPPVFSPSSREAFEREGGLPEGGVRQREPRENSDFLRVIVLEMNMRKAGKLGEEGGRARIWLPARRGEGGGGGGGGDREGGRVVPRRWVGVAVG